MLFFKKKRVQMILIFCWDDYSFFSFIYFFCFFMRELHWRFIAGLCYLHSGYILIMENFIQ